jgi:alpha-beta hydrolase superfamily lysophospholipase
VRIAGELERRHPGQPLQTIGISLGGAISLAASILHPQLFKSQVLLSPGLVPSLRLPLHRRLRLVRQALMQPTKLHDLPFSLADLSDRADWQKQAGEDPLRTRQVSARFAFETFRMQRFIRANVQRLRLPILALLAEKDTIINNLAVAAILSRTSAPRVRVETFEQAPHNLAVSLPRKEILDRLLPWLLQTGVSGEEGYTLVSVPPCPRVSETSPQPPPANVLVLPPQTEAALPEETDVLVLPPQTEAALPEETEGLSRA